MARRVWLDLHRWLGLKLSIVISFVLVTGTLATVSHEIDWLLDDTRRVWPPQRVERIDWQGIHDAAQAAYPEWAQERLIAPEAAWFAAEVWAYTPTGERRRIWVHPKTLSVQGDTAWVNAQRILRDSHRRLMIFSWWGITIVSSLSLLLLGSLVSGLIVYKKFWRGFFRKPRARDARTLWGDLHRLAGVWSIWFVFLMALTGLWYLVESLGARPSDYPKTAPEEVTRSAPQASLTRLARQAEASLDDFEVHHIALPHSADEPVRFFGQTDAVLVRDRANAVEIARQSGTVEAVTDAADLSVHQRIAEMADPLHFGTFAGLPGKLVYFVFGVFLSGLSLSGVYIYSRRLRQSAERTAARRATGAAALEAAE